MARDGFLHQPFVGKRRPQRDAQAGGQQSDQCERQRERPPGEPTGERPLRQPRACRRAGSPITLAGEPLDAFAQRLGRGVTLAMHTHRLAQPPQRIHLGTQPRVLRDACLHLEPARELELAVDEGVQLLRFEFVLHHVTPPCPERDTVRSTGRAPGVKACRISARDRARRDITVPIGRSAMRAMSLYERSSSSRSTSTSR